MRVSGQFYFFTKRFHIRKKQKTQISDFHSDIFYAHIEHKKHKTSIKRFSSSEMFFMSIKILSFLFHTQKAQKAHKKHKNGYR